MDRLAKFGVILTATLLCWTTPVLAGKTVSYRDSVEETGTLDRTHFPPLISVQIKGTGEGTHLGSFQMEGSHLLTFTSPEGGKVTGQATYTFHDGSTLQITYTGTFTNGPHHRLLDLDVLLGQGTGRLAGVTGIAATIAIVSPGKDPDTPSFTYTTEGFLTFP